MTRRATTGLSADDQLDPITDEELFDEASEIREEIGATVTALMPWGISILVHVALIVLAFFLVWQTIVKGPKEQPVVPNLPTAKELTTFTTDPTEDPTEEIVTGGGEAFAVEIAPVEPVDITTIGNDFSAPQPFTGKSFSDLTGKFKGPNQGDHKNPIFGGTADEVVFLIDASGSMVDVLPFVINELKRVVNKMQPRVENGRTVYQEATVIFFSGEGVHEVPGGGGIKGMRPMTPQFKAQVQEWVALENFNYDTGGRGSAHVKAAMTRALSYEPELIILLSDNLTGGGQGATQHELMQDDLLEMIHKHNKAKPPTKINTIQFLYEDPLVRHGLQGTLDRIAEETGGEARFITQQMLNLR
ncbi:MAG: hypothetical protein AAF711_14450 [Planctomycetota bacterium]